VTDAPRAPGADEVRARRNLRLAVGAFDALPAPPTSGWWDELYDTTHDDHHRPETPPPPAPRLGNWRKGEAVDLRGNRPDDASADSTKGESAVDEEQLLDDDTEGEWEDVQEPEPAAARRTPARARRPSAGTRAQHEYAQLPARARLLIYTGTAAATGYGIGLVPLMEGWITDCGHANGTAGAIALGVGLAVATGVLIDHRTRAWWGPLPWVCRIPLASAILALLLYAPGVTS
jgi:hypothetical protein